MQNRKLGNSNLEVSAIGLGCMGMSFGLGAAGDKKEISALLYQIDMTDVNIHITELKQ